MRGKSKKGKNLKKVTKNVPPTLPTSQHADGTSAPGQSTLLGTMYLYYRKPCSLAEFTNTAKKNDYTKFPLLFNRRLKHIVLTKNHL